VGTNCYVVATSAGSECLVIDPARTLRQVWADLVREHRLKPVSVLLTHGHVDHMWSVAPVAGAYDAAAWIHPEDRHLLTDPLAGISPSQLRCCSAGRTSSPNPTTSETSATA
jgi:glyoxylase-like metal-dependent hydrolase (beta-lactamase superfamily II)